MKRGGWLLCAILLGVAVRGPYWVEALRTPVDGDTAIVGLMAESSRKYAGGHAATRAAGNAASR